MKDAFRRSGISLLVVLALGGLYLLTVVPYVEPPLQRRLADEGTAAQNSNSPDRTGSSTSTNKSFAIQQGQLNYLSDLFPAGSWELDSPKVVKTDRAIFLFQNWEPRPDRRLEINPCSVVLLPAPESTTEPADQLSNDTYVVMTAPGGAVLQFDEDSEPERAQFGSLIGGYLPGEITIRRPESQAGAADDLELITQNIQIDQQQVWTTADVRFRFGATWGKGRDLAITLQPHADPDPNNLLSSMMGAVKFIELIHVDQIHVELPADDQKQPAITAPPTSTSDSTNPLRPASFSLSGNQRGPLDIRCQGPFRIDLLEQLASFEDQVEVTRPAGPDAQDVLRCEILRLHFRRQPTSLPAGPGDSHESPAVTAAAIPRADHPANAHLFELDRLVAIGQPVHFEFPSLQALARGERLEYNARSQLLHLEDQQGALLQYGNQQIEAPNIQYELTPSGQGLGRAWASGPGRMQRTSNEPQAATMSATWGRELLLRPVGAQHVLSLTGGASFGSTGMGEFRAAEFHAWLTQFDTAKSPSSNSYDLDRLLAQGEVEFQGPGLQGRTERLEAWFTREPAELNSPRAVRPVSTGSRSAGPTGNSGESTAETNTAETNTDQRRFDVRGNLLRVQVAHVGPRYRVDEISIQGEVAVREVAGQPDVTDPLLVTGELLTVKDVDTEQSTLRVTGKPARLSARGMTMVSSTVALNQKENRVWIDDAGQMTLPPLEGRPRARGQVLFENRDPLESPRVPDSDPNQPQRFDPTQLQRATSAPAPILVSWKGRLDFDGQTARFQKDVQVRGAYRLSTGEIFESLITGGQLDVMLKGRVNFSGGNSGPDSSADKDVELQSIGFSGNVFLDGRTTMSDVITSVDRMQIRNLTLNHQTEEIFGEGPGWLSSTRLEKEASAAAATARLTYMYLDFIGQVKGSSKSQSVEFQEQVRAIHGPVGRWNEQLDLNRPESLPDSAVTLLCQRMALSKMAGTLPTTPSGLEFEATGNATIEGQKFLARAARVTYSQAKDLIIMAGQGGTDAEFWKKPRAESSKADAIARSVLLWRRDGRVQVDQAKYINLNTIEESLPRRGNPGTPPPFLPPRPTSP